MIIIMIKIINDNIVYKLGRNAKENFLLIDEANNINGDYWWFHLEDHPSGHCIVHDKNIDKSSVVFAGSLVKSYSKLKNQKKVKIIYVQIKNIMKTKTLGEVILNQKPNVITI
jgi:predicted ribosome quality control (RQC) complex YloA/Tae2 family protein